MSHSRHEGNEGRDVTVGQSYHQTQVVIRELWIDIEDTCATPVVNGWYNTELINIDKILNFMSVMQPDQVHIFSFAIWNEKERSSFNTHLRPRLEQALGVKLGIVWTVDDNIIPTCCAQMGMHRDMVDFQEASNFWSKQGAFRHCMRHRALALKAHNLKLHATLLDDAVYNETIEWHDLGASVHQWNIDQLP